LTFTLSLVVLVTLVGGSIAYISLHNGQAAVEELAAQLLEQTLVNVEQKLADYLAMPHMLNRLNTDRVRQDPAGLTDFERLRAEYIQQLRAFDPIMTVAIGTEAQGEYIGVGRRDGETYESGVMQRAVDDTYRVYLLDSAGVPLKVLSEKPGYDARVRPWYQAGAQAGKAAWSPIYIWASRQHVGIAAVLPIYDASGALLGVQQSALSLDYISKFLSELRVGKSGQVFLMEPSGLLVASSATEKPVRPGETGTDLARFAAAASADPFTRAAAEQLTARFGDLNQLPNAYQSRISVAGQPYFLSAERLRDPHGLDWIAVIGVPEADFLAQVAGNTRTTVLLCCLALLIALALGVVTARRIAQPIRRLNSAAQALASGQWEHPVTIHRSDEVGDLARQFNMMAAALIDKETQLRAHAEQLEQRVAERTAALRESQRQLAALLDNLPGMAYRCANDPHWTMEYLSEGCLGVTGYAAAELIGNATRAYNDLIIPEDQQRVWDTVETAVGRRATFVLEYRIRTKNGESRWVWEKGSGVFSDEGNLLALEGFISDTTERKKAEEAVQHSEAMLRATLDAIPEAAFLMDSRGVALAGNATVAQRLGVAPEQIIGANVYDLLPPDVAARRRGYVAQVVKTGQPVHFEDQRGERTIENAMYPVLDAQGSVVQLSVIGLDITERKQAEIRLAEAAQELARSNADLEQFAHIASHDLQEPLRMVTSYLRLLEQRYRGRLGADADEYIAFAVDGTRRMQRLITDLLAYSRVGTGAPLPGLTDCETVVEQALSNLQVTLTESGAAVTHDPLPTVMADPGQVLQLFQNLIGNAVKFHGAEPPRVHVSARLTSAEDGLPISEAIPPGVNRKSQIANRKSEWEFAVRDNGIGIAPRQFERIFMVFRRLHTPAEYPGTGIGLAICKKIVERHGGRIWVESEEGRGTTFYFTLPAA